MKITYFTRLCIMIIALFSTILPARAGAWLHRARHLDGASGDSWSGDYYDPAWGMPAALVIPPTAKRQTKYSWGVGGTRVAPTGAQFQSQSPAPESVYHQGNFLPAPPQPSDTDQHGINYVRGPR